MVNQNFLIYLFLKILDVVIGVSVSGMIKLWSLEDLDKKVNIIFFKDFNKILLF